MNFVGTLFNASATTWPMFLYNIGGGMYVPGRVTSRPYGFYAGTFLLFISIDK